MDKEQLELLNQYIKSKQLLLTSLESFNVEPDDKTLDLINGLNGVIEELEKVDVEAFLLEEKIIRLENLIKQ